MRKSFGEDELWYGWRKRRSIQLWAGYKKSPASRDRSGRWIFLTPVANAGRKLIVNSILGKEILMNDIDYSYIA